MTRRAAASLRRLGIDTIDLYQIHAPDPDVPLEATLEALDALVVAGKIRALAVSNFPAWLLAWAFRTRDYEVWAPFVTLQAQYSVVERSAEVELLPLHSRHRGWVSCHGAPLGGWFLTGQLQRGGGGGGRQPSSGRPGRCGGSVASPRDRAELPRRRHRPATWLATARDRSPDRHCVAAASARGDLAGHRGQGRHSSSRTSRRPSRCRSPMSSSSAWAATPLHRRCTGSGCSPSRTGSTSSGHWRADARTSIRVRDRGVRNCRSMGQAACECRERLREFFGDSSLSLLVAHRGSRPWFTTRPRRHDACGTFHADDGRGPIRGSK
jgi:hypothetical protein